MVSITITRLWTMARAAAVALVLGALASAPSAASTGDAARHVSPATAERIYLECVDGAPTSPDAHEHWVVDCRDDAAAGLG